VRNSPSLHAAFASGVAKHLEADARFLGVAAAGSWVTGDMDEQSDLDLVLCVADAAYADVMKARPAIAAELGPLLTAYTGEMAGDPRLLICLYGPPLLQVDLKFLRSTDLARRVDEPEILWERGRAMSDAYALGKAHVPKTDLQGVEDRFWGWVHYAVRKVSRGELLQLADAMALIRHTALGPLSLERHGQSGRGVRQIERLAPTEVPALLGTLVTHDERSCLAAIDAAVAHYRALREAMATPTLVRRTEAERLTVALLAEARAASEAVSRRAP
jgi:hypothetical protein